MGRRKKVDKQSLIPNEQYALHNGRCDFAKTCSWINITVQKYRLNPIPTHNLFLKSVGNDSWLTRVKNRGGQTQPFQATFLQTLIKHLNHYHYLQDY